MKILPWLGIAMTAVCIGADAQSIHKCVGKDGKTAYSTTSASGPRSVRVVYDCPSDRSPDGRAVSKGRSELSVVSASPQAFRIEMKSTVYGGYVMEGTRIGNCEQR